ncbi:permease prefix domain 1-containing protein [Pseudarthrobacter sp. J64]|uniref:permease prefix domain 1-containing protein n=1 Tax=Pseudarthrobacter sp. J64 TaxID=3116485 RepID=UPI002E8042F8|nr:permease prefix domain 1-containing protein [Pseudarthrobacter sp. J64]MEE2570531.1 permease prefix domain 1-containing protein [Pseudarthrobacter sp. J64]
MTSLTDRYIWAAGRSVPDGQRTEFGQELRERIGDAIDARMASGADQDAAEREALAELGDPARTAARYIDRPLHLIGPRHYLSWLRLLKTIAAVALPFGAAGILLGQLISGAPAGQIIGATVAGAISIAVHVFFWVTLVFVIVERSGSAPTEKWSLEQLPELPDSGRTARRSELIASLVLLAAFIAAIVWQHFGVVFRDGVREPIPLLNPALWSFWIPYFILLLVVEAAFAVAVFRTGWTWTLAIVNAVLNLAFIVPAMWLFLTGQLVDPAFLGAIGWPWGPTSGPVIAAGAAVAVFLGAGWDIFDGFRRATSDSTSRQVQPAL